MVRISKKQIQLNHQNQKKASSSSSSSSFWRNLLLLLGLVGGILVLSPFQSKDYATIVTDLEAAASSAAAVVASSSSSTTTISSTTTASTTTTTTKPTISYQSPLAYGTKSGKEQTAQLVKDAIQVGFRHIVTGGHHSSHNETGVGYGWKQSGIPREELFLETCFVPWNGKDFQRQPDDLDPADDTKSKNTKTIPEQVHHAIATSLQNLQTNYIDAVVFHNFRATLIPFDEMLQAWRVLEDYVEKGTIRYLGMTSVHDMNHLEQLRNVTKVPLSILQNRFHSNRRYDIPNQATFRKQQHDHVLQIQRFWLLNGSSGYGRANKEMATQKGITTEQLLLGFVMSLGANTCLVGTHNIQHMKDDVEMTYCYQYLFQNDEERLAYANKLGFRPPDWSLYNPIVHPSSQADFDACRQRFDALSNPTVTNAIAISSSSS